MEYLSDRLKEPDDFYEVFSWEKLSQRSQNTLKRAIETRNIWGNSELSGFSFDLLSTISVEDLYEARSVGQVRAEELIQELITLFEDLNQRSNLDRATNIASKIVSGSSIGILAKLTVEEDLNLYLERISLIGIQTPQQRRKFLQEMRPSESSIKGRMFGKAEHEIALGHLIEANLRFAFTFAQRVSPDRDLRARTVASNLGLLAGIKSFSDKSNDDFQTHIMKNIREYVEELIDTFNLSYDEIVEIMMDKNGSNFDDENVEEKSETNATFESCTTFSQLFEEIDRELLKLPEVDERALAMLKHRHHAFGEPGLTLDEIGRNWGVTRERVRQIVAPLMEVRIQLENEVPLLLKAVEIFEECEDEDEFKAKVADNEIFSGEHFSWQRLWGVTRIMSPRFLADRVYGKHREMESESAANSPIRMLIKRDRSKFGLYDLEVITKRYKVNPDKAFKIISEIYPRSIRCGSVVLARTKNLDTMFENSIAKQLMVSSPLSVEELRIGLNRTGNYRGVSVIGSSSDLFDLIEHLAGAPPSLQILSFDLIKEIEFHTIEKWLIEVFSDSSLGILHSNEVVSRALRERTINVSSINVYLLTSPIIRSFGKSIYGLVGTDVSQDQLDSYSQIIRRSSEASEVSYEISDISTGILHVKPNLNVITSGIVFPPSGYRKIFEEFEFQSSCFCGELKTIQSVKFSNSGFWTGFTAMIRHGFSKHGMSKESTFRFEFNFDNSKVQLLPH